MKYLKFYEAYSVNDYEKALKSLKVMIKSDRDKDDVLSFINRYFSDSAKNLDNLRIMLDRIDKFYLQFSQYLNYNRKEKYVKNRKSGQIEDRSTFDTKKFFIFDASDKDNLVKFLSSQKKVYNDNIESINDINVSAIKFLINKLFEILDWVNETGISKKEIYISKYAGAVRKSDEDVLRDMEKMNEMEFENEFEEVKSIIRKCKKQIKIAINSSVE